MASKKNKKRTNDEPKEPTRKQVHLSARERKRNQRVLIGTGVAIGLAILFVIIGVVYEFAYKPSSALATVGEDKIVTRDYWKRVFLEQNQLQNQLVQYSNLERQFGSELFAQQIAQIENTLFSPEALGSQVLDQMINETIIKQEAEARGITVADEEIDEALREQVAQSRQELTVPQATQTAEGQAQATATADSWTPTPDPTIDVNSAITETEEAPTAAPPPTQAVMDETGYQEGLDELASNIKDISGMTLAEYREVIRTSLLADKVREAIGEAEVEPFAEEVQARHILLTTEEPENALAGLVGGDAAPETASLVEPNSEDIIEEKRTLAEELRQRIIDGEDFTALAEEYSDDPGSAASGGDLGWFGRGMMVPEFEEAAFTLGVDEVSEPIKTDYGFHIIQVLDKDDQRPKDEATIQNEQAQAFNQWLLLKASELEIKEPSSIVTRLPINLDTSPLQIQGTN